MGEKAACSSIMGGSREPLSPIGTMLTILEHGGELSHIKDETLCINHFYFSKEKTS